MEIDHVEAFLAIVRHGGFSRAAHEIHLSQPAISRRIRLLEAELGSPLFERLRGGAVVSEAGRAFLPHAESLLAAARDGSEAVADQRGDSRGAVTLAVVGTLASYPLTATLLRFREKHPGVDLRIVTGLSAGVSELVRRGDASLGLRYGDDHDRALSARALFDEPLLPVCGAGHRLAHRRRVEPGELRGERWLAFPPRQGVPQELYAAAVTERLAACGLHDAEILPIDSLTAQKRMVEAGFGLALLPESSLDEELRSRTLRVLRAPALRASVRVAMIRRRNAFESGAARALAEALAGWKGAASPSG